MLKLVLCFDEHHHDASIYQVLHHRLDQFLDMETGFFFPILQFQETQTGI